MSYYLPTVLIQSVGLDESMARLIAACASVAYLIASLIAAPLVEKVGRRIMMIVSTAVQLFCFLLVTILLYYAESPGYAHKIEVAKASVVWFILYYMGFGLGMLGVCLRHPRCSLRKLIRVCRFRGCTRPRLIRKYKVISSSDTS